MNPSNQTSGVKDATVAAKLPREAPTRSPSTNGSGSTPPGRWIRGTPSAAAGERGAAGGDAACPDAGSPRRTAGTSTTGAAVARAAPSAIWGAAGSAPRASATTGAVGTRAATPSPEAGSTPAGSTGNEGSPASSNGRARIDTRATSHTRCRSEAVTLWNTTLRTVATSKITLALSDQTTPVVVHPKSHEPEAWVQKSGDDPPHSVHHSPSSLASAIICSILRSSSSSSPEAFMSNSAATAFSVELSKKVCSTRSMADRRATSRGNLGR